MRIRELENAPAAPSRTGRTSVKPPGALRRCSVATLPGPRGNPGATKPEKRTSVPLRGRRVLVRIETFRRTATRSPGDASRGRVVVASATTDQYALRTGATPKLNSPDGPAVPFRTMA